MLAIVVNDEVGSLTPRGVLRFFASMLAPKSRFSRQISARLTRSGASHSPHPLQPSTLR